ncbi:MAG: hypothetical protein IPN72_08790 [Saprospiraceae bacterium]|nr:hypothetical protein [Saprospiraceae bacterium]
MTEPRKWLVSGFKVCSGTVSAGDHFINTIMTTMSANESNFIAEGKNRTAANQLKAGDLGVTVNSKILTPMIHLCKGSKMSFEN